MASELSEVERAQDILRRRPRLALVLIAVDDLTANRRTCRVSIDVSSGVIRLFREVPERQIPLDASAPSGPSG